MGAPAFAETLPDFICPRVTIGDPTADQSKIVGSTVAIFVTGRATRPMTAMVEGLDNYPAGTQLTMNFQNFLGLGQPNDGEIMHVEPGTSDGTLQDICGVDSNVLMIDHRKNQNYCGTCSVNPAFKL